MRGEEMQLGFTTDPFITKKKAKQPDLNGKFAEITQ